MIKRQKIVRVFAKVAHRWILLKNFLKYIYKHLDIEMSIVKQAC
jgi:hypothetical protein